MSQIDDVFRRLKGEGRKALMPFITAGDPDLPFTAPLLRELAGRGASMCELGIPYSDPIADGPVIQASYSRALGHKVSLEAILDLVARESPSLGIPLATMVSYAIVYRYGPARYVEAARRAGVAGLIVPDLPVEESRDLAAACNAADLSLIQLVTPTTPRDRAARIAENSTGFVYYVSVTGITGERAALPPDLESAVTWLRGRTPLPICIGFGVSTVEHVRTLAPIADGLIVGSAIVRRVARAATEPREAVQRDVGEFIASLAAALDAAEKPAR